MIWNTVVEQFIDFLWLFNCYEPDWIIKLKFEWHFIEILLKYNVEIILFLKRIFLWCSPQCIKNENRFFFMFKYSSLISNFDLKKPYKAIGPIEWKGSWLGPVCSAAYLNTKCKLSPTICQKKLVTKVSNESCFLPRCSGQKILSFRKIRNVTFNFLSFLTTLAMRF